MIKKLIALVFVSFFVMSGLTILTENNQNYNIAENNQINSFVDSSSFSPINYIINESITYSSGISSGGQTFVCYDNALYYIYGDKIIQFNVSSKSITTFLTLSSNPAQLEIYNNYMFISYMSGGGYGYSATEINIYNFLDSNFYTFNLTNAYDSIQFSVINNIIYFVSDIYSKSTACIYSLSLSPISYTLIKSISINAGDNQFAFSGYNNTFMFAINGGGNPYPLEELGIINISSQSLIASTSNSGDYFGNIGSIINLGNCGLLGSQSYYINDNNLGGTTQYSYNAYSSGLFFSDSNYKNLFIPMNLTNYAFLKLPTLINNTNYQEFFYNNTIKYIYLPIGTNNNIFNSLTYIINGNNHLFIVNGNNLYVYPELIKSYHLNVKSFNFQKLEINNYFALNGIIYSGLSNNFIFTTFPQNIVPLNYSSYVYNGSVITLSKSDFSGSGSNLYYNLSIYYSQIKSASIPLYDIFTYMYPISIIGLFVGMGAFVFAIKKRGYKI